MDSPIMSCKDKLAQFRMKELKDILTQLGANKQGRKQDLIHRIQLLLVQDEGLERICQARGVGKIIDNTYREMLKSIAAASKVNPSAFFKAGHSQMYKMIRCICGSSLAMDPMIQCKDSNCQVWQHMGCVTVPGQNMDLFTEIPSPFYCELCRISTADPFWVTSGLPLLTIKLVPTGITPTREGMTEIVDREFNLSRDQEKLLLSAEYELQVWCILLNDKIQCRIHWPVDADLWVNGVQFQVFNRPSSQLLGINGRDDCPVIKSWCNEGTNKFFLSWRDLRTFCLGIRVAKRRTVKELLELVPKEEIGETFGQALARVCRCISGGNCMDNNSSDCDSDLEVVADSVTINLRCPLSGSRMKIAGRFKPCAHMGCFDLETFLKLNQLSHKWQCPICIKNYSLEELIIDPYFSRITSMLQNCDEDVTEIEMKSDGSWRVSVNDQNTLSLWHSPDGSLQTTEQEETYSVDQVNCSQNYEIALPITSASTAGDPSYIAQALACVNSPTVPFYKNTPGLSDFSPMGEGTDPRFLGNYKNNPDLSYFSVMGERIDPRFLGNFENSPNLSDFSPMGEGTELNPLFLGNYGNNPNLAAFHDDAPCFEEICFGGYGDVNLTRGPSTDDWVSLSLAAGVVHDVADQTIGRQTVQNSVPVDCDFPIMMNNGVNLGHLNTLFTNTIFSSTAEPQLVFTQQFLN